MSSPAPGRIDKYEIQSLLGEGAFGRVYRAYDPTVGRPVAIKVLTTESQDLNARFRTEASAAGNLRHKNIVTIYEFGEYSGRPFIAMELLEGQDLSEVITSHHSLTLLDKLHIVSQIAEGLHCAHSYGVLHRDVKPANIKVLPDGTVKILDFGIARLTEHNDAARLTQRGDLIGTILYMAPEQFSGGEVDRLCDIFAFGEICYELLAGKHPFAAADARTAMFNITFREPEPLRHLVPGLPEAIEQVVHHALQKDRELRYQSLRDLLIDTKPTLFELEREHANSLLVVAKELFARGELEAAEAKAGEILDLDLGIREAHEIRDAAHKQIQLRIVQTKVDALLRSARDNLAGRRQLDAIANFEAALRLDRHNPEVRQGLEDARKLHERGRRISRLLLDVHIELEGANLQDASKKVVEALELDPEHSEARRLREEIAQRFEARRREEGLQAGLREAELLLETGQADAALEKVEWLLSRGGCDDRIPALFERACALRLQAARAKHRTGTLEMARDLAANSDFRGAEDILAGLAKEFPEDEEILALQNETVSAREKHNRESAIAAAILEVRTARDSGGPAAAMPVLDAAIGQWPGDDRLSLLHAELEAELLAQAAIRVVEQPAAAVSEPEPPDVEAALAYRNQVASQLTADPSLERQEGILREALVGYPEEPYYRREMDRVLGLRSQVEHAVGQARAAETSGHYEQALEAWARLRTIYPLFPDLQPEIRRLTRKVIEIRGMRLRRIGDIERAIAANDIERAEELLSQADPEFTRSAAAELAGLRVRVQAIAAANRRLEQARKAFAERKYMDAADAFREAARHVSSDPTRTEQIASELAERACAIVPSDMPAAQSILLTASQIAHTPALDTLTSRIEEQRHTEAVEAALDQCRDQEASGDLEAAQQTLAAALTAHPGNPLLTANLERVRTAIESRPRSETAAPVAPAAPLAPAADERPPAKAPWPSRRVLLAVVCAAVVGIAGTIVWRQLTSVSPLRRISISSDLKGAEVSIGGKTCITPQCVFDLPPGTYTLAGHKPGYRPVSRPLTIVPGQPAASIGMAFEPLPLLLRVNTNLDSGTVYLDGKSAGELRNGQFLKSGIEPGTHTLQVTSKRSDFKAQFTAAPAEAPRLRGPVAASDVVATVITNAGDSGSLACNCDAQNVDVDGSKVGVASRNGAIPLTGLAQGARHVAIQGRSIFVEIGPNPALNVFLAADRNNGTLVVETGQEDSRIYIDDRPYRGIAINGIARIPVDVGEHTVRVEREGFRAPAAQRIRVAKGEEKQVLAPLTAIPPVLELANALPGADVAIDGRNAGRVGQDGSFRTELPAGEHSIALTRDAYTPAQFSAQFSPGKSVRPGPSEIAMTKVPVPVTPPQIDRETQDWDRVRNTKNASEVEAFLRNHPAGAHSGAAKEIVARLKQQEQDAVRERARAADQAAWEGTDRNAKTSLQDYLARFGSGAHAQEARTLIAQLDQRELDKARAAQEKNAADRGAVLDVLSAYGAAFASRNVKALRAIWPEVPESTMDALRASKSMTNTLSPTGEPVISGDIAKVTCERTTIQQVPGQSSFSKKVQVAVTFRRSGNSWIIQKIE